MRESYSFKTESSKSEKKRGKPAFSNNEYKDYAENSDTGVKVSSKMLIRNDPKFQSQYNFEADERIVLPMEIKKSHNKISAEEEFNHLMQSSQYSSGSGDGMSSPDRVIHANKSSAMPVRESKHRIFPQIIEKPTTREKRSTGLRKAGDSIISNELSLSQERSIGFSHPSNTSAYLPKSSENYPSASTALNSSSTVMRIRGKNSRISTKNYINISADHKSSSQSKRKDIMKAAERLRKIEMIEKKRIGKVKDEIIKLEETRKKEDEERKQKRKELLERKQKLIQDRKKLELKKLKRLEKEKGENTMAENSKSTKYDIRLL